MQLNNFLLDLQKMGQKNKDIFGILLVGSYARNEARQDSDIDIVILTKNPNLYLDDYSFANLFGDVDKIEKEFWGKVTSVRVWYKNGYEVEFGITTPDWAAVPLDAGTERVLTDGHKIIYEEINLLSNIKMIIS